jgi:prevent-host-death family protein
MKSISVTEARKQIYKLLDEASKTNEPLQIIGKRSNAVLIGEKDWNALQETLHLISIPGMRESIIDGINTPLSETSKKLDW